jgi:hypothetical protein
MYKVMLACDEITTRVYFVCHLPSLNRFPATGRREEPFELRRKKTPNAQRPTPNVECGITLGRRRERREAAV